jgi:hypothetical protein
MKLLAGISSGTLSVACCLVGFLPDNTFVVACSYPMPCGDLIGYSEAWDDDYSTSNCNCPTTPVSGRCHPSGSYLDITTFYDIACMIYVEAYWQCSQDSYYSFLEYFNDSCAISCLLTNCTSSAWIYDDYIGNQCDSEVDLNYTIRIVQYYYTCGTCNSCTVLRSHNVLCD